MTRFIYNTATWARHHLVISRALWMLSYGLLATLSLLMGFMTGTAYNMSLSPYWLMIPLLSSIPLILKYPQKQAFIEVADFLKRRVRFDAVLYILIASVWVWTGSYLTLQESSSNTFSHHSPITLASYVAKPNTSSGQSNSSPKKFNRKSLRKELKKQLQRTPLWQKIRTWPKGLQFLFFIALAYIVGIIALGLAVLSCQLSCAGNAGAAILVVIFAVLGILVSVALFLYAFVALFRPRLNSYRVPNKIREEINS